jgi:Zn finger protein HypA/HybF involved in hydrogenase expression
VKALYAIRCEDCYQQWVKEVKPSELENLECNICRRKNLEVVGDGKVIYTVELRGKDDP